MSENKINLVSIFQCIVKNFKFIILVSLAAAIVGFIFSSIAERKYTSNTIVITKNPLLFDRNFTFRPTNYEHKHYFAIPDDIDQVQVISKTDGLIMHLIRTFDLENVYGIKDQGKLMKKVKSLFKFKREDTKNLDLSYTDADPERATAIVKEARSYIENVFRHYFLEANRDVVVALETRASLIADTIVSIDNEIQSIREQTKNYSSMLPNRGLHIASASGAVTPQTSALLERLKEITELKDKLVSDKAEYASLINEYGVFGDSQIRMFYIIQDAYVPIAASNMNEWIIALASFLIGFFFASIIVLLKTSIKFVRQLS